MNDFQVLGLCLMFGAVFVAVVGCIYGTAITADEREYID